MESGLESEGWNAFDFGFDSVLAYAILFSDSLFRGGHFVYTFAAKAG